MEFYYKAVMENKALFEDKIVLDVGCGLGFLSILAAKAGAKKVYAVEASSQVFVLAQSSFVKSGYDSVIEAVNKPMEEVVIENRYVDIIISEWMGYCLFYEQMLPSVLFARDKYCPQVIIPDEASLFIVGFYNKSYYHQRLDWTQEQHYGVDLSSVKEDICSEISNDNCLGCKYEGDVTNPNIITTSSQVFQGSLYDIPAHDEIDEGGEEANLVDETNFELRLKYPERHKRIHGIIIYFETNSKGRNGQRLTLTTSPYGLPTHWQQSICLFKEALAAPDGKSIVGSFQLKAYSGAKKQGRGIQILLKIKDSQYQYILP